MNALILGAGPAGVTAAETLRAHDGEAEITVLSAEPYPPYAPPAMLDHFITGSQLHYWRGQDWAERLGVDYRSGVRVTAVEPQTGQVHTDRGESIPYDKLVLAMGSRLHAPLKGAELPGVCNFKSLRAAEALVERVRRGEVAKAVVVGAGFIGVEIALLLHELGVAVTQVEMADQVMPRVLDADTAAVVLEALQQRGIEVRLETKAAGFLGEKRAEALQLESGETLQADLLIAATGVRPNVEPLEGSGLPIGWGVLVDEHLQVAPDIYAAGDLVEAPDRLSGETYVHAIFPNAVAQGKVVGLNLAGFDVRYEGADSMNSLKHLGVPVMVAGLKRGDEVLRLKDDGALRTLYLEEDRLVGFQLAGDVRAAGVLHALMLRRQPLGALKDRLLEPGFGQGILAHAAMAGIL